LAYRDFTHRSWICIQIITVAYHIVSFVLMLCLISIFCGISTLLAHFSTDIFRFGYNYMTYFDYNATGL